MTSDKIICLGCGRLGNATDLLTAQNPFDPEDTIQGCPLCFVIDQFDFACDEPNCWKPIACGLNTPQGYRSVCSDHSVQIRRTNEQQSPENQ